MKRLCIVIEIADDRPDLLLAAVALNAAVQAGGELRSGYIEPLLPQTYFERLLGVQRTGERNEFFPPNHNTAGFEPARN